MFIKFDSFVTSKEYRIDLLDRAGLTLVNDDIETMSCMGGGSSFDKMKFSDQPSNMKIFKRYEQLSGPHHQLYNKLIKDYPRLSEIQEEF